MLMASLGGVFEDEAVIAQGLAFITIFDWLIDRVETMQNVWSDCVACKIFDALDYDDLKKDVELTETADAKREPEENFCTSTHPESSLPQRYLSSDRAHVDHCYQLAGLT